MSIKTVGVIGCGTMGGGITQVSAAAGYKTIVLEANDTFLSKGMAKIEKFLDRAIAKEKLTPEDKEKTMGNITGTTSVSDLADCDLVIEAISEDINLKNEIFTKLDETCKPETIFATNTSSLTVLEIATITKRRDKVAGMHFFNPVPLMQLVEVVRTIETSDETYNTCWEFAKTVEKIPVATKDSTGFIVNRLLIPYLLDAILVLQNGLASIKDIDNGMKFGCGHPMGPLTLLDLIGLDIINNIANIMYEEYKEPRFAPPSLLKQMIMAGFLGKKTKIGFYDYSGDEPIANDKLTK